MRHQMTPNFAPDGMGNGVNAAPVRNASNNQTPAAMKTETQNDNDRDHGYDDGLVHSHAWACTSNRKN